MKPISLPRLAGRLSLVALAAVAALASLACTSLELGARPSESLQPVTAAADVKYVEANGLRFAYLEEGSGPLILMMHGYPETARTWAAVQRRLASAGYRVVAPYSRGYPPSAFAADGDYSIPTLGQDLVALIEALGEKSAIVVGHDWGASAAYAAATTRPDKVSQLVALSVPHPRAVLGDKSFLLEAPQFIYYQLPWAERLVWSHDFAHLDRVYHRASPHYQVPPAVLADAKATLRAPGAVDAAIGYYRSAFENRLRDRPLAQRPVTVPSLVITGQADGSFKLPRFEAARPAFSGRYQLVVLDGVGHYPALEAPDKTADAILAFVRAAP